MAYERLLGQAPGRTQDDVQYVLPGSARRSRLVQTLIGIHGQTATNGQHTAVALTDDEKRSLIEWIDLGARWKN